MVKRTKRQEREYRVLLGVVELYIEQGKPIGSNTLRQHGFEDLSSATIRNYFMELEKAGFLMQQHSSGGRIPTDAAFRVYAEENFDSGLISQDEDKELHQLEAAETKEVGFHLHHAADVLSRLTNTAVFLSAPRFDNDFIVDFKLVALDYYRCLCIVVTDFGLVKTEVLHTQEKLSSFSLKRIEGYFHWRLTGLDRPSDLSDEEEILAQRFYNEVMVRYIAGYTNFTHADICSLGFSHLLTYPDFNDGELLASSLALFEDIDNLRGLLAECERNKRLTFWIGDDLKDYVAEPPSCGVLAVPYSIGQNTVGAVGILGPVRLPYKKMFGILRAFSEYISSFLNRNVVKFKLTYRRPSKGKFVLTDKSSKLLLENKKMEKVVHD